MIDSVNNARIKSVSKLLKSSKERKKQHSYVVEGPRMVLEAVRHNAALHVYISESMMDTLDGDVKSIITGCGYDVVRDNVFTAISDTVTPQGIIAVAGMPSYSFDDIITSGDVAGHLAARYIILDNLQDPGNLGTILRTAEAAGFDAVLMNKGCVDAYNPKVVRSTMGAVFRLPFAYFDTAGEIIEECRRRDIVVMGASLEGEDIRNITFPDKLAIVIGNESKGIAKENTDRCSMLVKLPMAGQAESLNASVAAGILMYMSSLSFL